MSSETNEIEIENEPDKTTMPDKHYVVTMTFIMNAPDPVTAQMWVLKAEGIVPINISAEELNTE